MLGSGHEVRPYRDFSQELAEVAGQSPAPTYFSEGYRENGGLADLCELCGLL
jgi:hypothetical protein